MARVKAEDRHESYTEMRKTGYLAKETNDCSVISTALAAGITYEQSKKLYDEAGRKPRSGVNTFTIAHALANLQREYGVEFTLISSRRKIALAHKARVRTLTFNNITRVLDKSKNYIIIGKRHMVAYKDGRIADWSEGTKSYVEDIYVQKESNSGST
jgi:hypothetical protein